jgi:hypothetical protein
VCSTGCSRPSRRLDTSNITAMEVAAELREPFRGFWDTTQGARILAVVTVPLCCHPTCEQTGLTECASTLHARRLGSAQEGFDLAVAKTNKTPGRAKEVGR